MATNTCDVAIVGGGLSGGLIALALAAKRPDASIRLIEGGATLGGNHIWSFFGPDVAADDRWLVAPLVTKAWSGYDVDFPARRRSMATPYYSITSDMFDRVVRARLPRGTVMTEQQVLDTSATSVTLMSGDRIDAGGIIDCRGPADLSVLELGWQKFLGRELALKRPHGAERPTVMDASIEQIDGYRFVYTLPFSASRMFVEDTYYSDTPHIDRDALGARIDTYVAAKGWKTKAVVREETGALAVVIGGDFDTYWQSGGPGVAKAGVRAGLFQPTTGYSLPDAVRTAVAIATASDLSGDALHALTHNISATTWRSRRFYRMLNAMLFKAAEPSERYRILERFYGLDARLIGRFYAGRSTLADKARVLMGRPPVPIGRAVAAIRGQR